MCLWRPNCLRSNRWRGRGRQAAVPCARRTESSKADGGKTAPCNRSTQKRLPSMRRNAGRSTSTDWDADADSLAGSRHAPPAVPRLACHGARGANALWPWQYVYIRQLAKRGSAPSHERACSYSPRSRMRAIRFIGRHDGSLICCAAGPSRGAMPCMPLQALVILGSECVGDCPRGAPAGDGSKDMFVVRAGSCDTGFVHAG